MGCQRNHATKGKAAGERQRQLGEAATAQGGVISLDQLRELGISRRAASGRAGQSSLHRVHRGVYAVGHRSLARTTLLRAVTMACGDGAVISHATAAGHWGLSDRFPALVDVTVPVEAGRKLDGIRCRRCRYPDPTEVCVDRGVTCTTPARTLVDQAGSLGIATLRRRVERAAVLRLLDIEKIDLAIARAKGRRGVPALRAIVDEWRTEDGSVPDVRSAFEALVLPRLLALELPRPLCNQSIRVGSESVTADFLWPEHGLVVETDGRQTHETPAAFQRDRRRDQFLLAHGYRVARVTWRQVRDELEDVVARIAHSLGPPSSSPSVVP